jgi:isopropylmalate/homocitrate/citramalate synthase
VNDKFDIKVKIEIFKALESLQIKVGDILKPMIPQLQTTFIKALTIPEANDQLFDLLNRNIMQLLKLTPKIDNVVRELLKALSSIKDE